jgi:hypothetical protein
MEVLILIVIPGPRGFTATEPDCVGRTANASAMDGASLSSAFALNELQQRHWIPAFAGMTAIWIDQSFVWTPPVWQGR